MILGHQLIKGDGPLPQRRACPGRTPPPRKGTVYDPTPGRATKLGWL
jgi:hypothetical protein